MLETRINPRMIWVTAEGLQSQQVEILEVETEEERLRTHRLQTRIVQLSGAT